MNGLLGGEIAGTLREGRAGQKDRGRSGQSKGFHGCILPDG
jgi:hypothetical protein